MHKKNLKSLLSIFMAVIMVLALPMVNVSAAETDKIKVQYSSACVYEGETTKIKFSSNGIKTLACKSFDTLTATVMFNSSKSAVEIKGVGIGTTTIRIYSKSNKNIFQDINVKVYPKVSHKIIHGNNKNKVWENNYFGLKYDFSDFDSDTKIDYMPDYYIKDSSRSDYPILNINNKSYEACLFVVDSIKYSKFLDISSDMTYSNFYLKLLAQNGMAPYYLTSVTLTSDELDGVTFYYVTGKLHKHFYESKRGKSLKDENAYEYLNMMMYKKDNYFIVLMTLGYEKPVMNELKSHLSILK